MRRGTALAMVVAAALAGCSGGEAEEPSARADAPNVVLIVTDDQALDSLTAMPYLSSQPGGHWVTFDRAYVEDPACCPSRASILSGQWSHHTGVTDNQKGRRFDESTSFVTALDDAGYQTAMVGKYLNLYPFGRDPFVPEGWDEWFAFLGGNYFDYDIFDGERTRHFGSADPDYSTDVLAGQATRFVEEAKEPFFLYLAPNAPHTAIDHESEAGAEHEKLPVPASRHKGVLDGRLPPPAPSFDEADVTDKPDWVQRVPRLAPDVRRRAATFRQLHLEAVHGVDDALRSVFTSLERRGVFDRTLVVFLSDNGFLFGEHRVAGKFCAYEGCVRTPLRVRWPGGPQRTDKHLVQNVDIAPTVLELAGVEPPVEIDGRSLLPLLESREGSWRDDLVLSSAGAGPKPGFWGIRDDRWKYVELVTGERELYDLRADPDELLNLADDPAHVTTVAELSARLTRLRAAAGAE